MPPPMTQPLCRLSPIKNPDGFWHNWAAGASDGYQQGQFANMNLTDIPAEYNVVAVAFMKGRGIPTFKPYNLSDAEFRRRWAC